MSADRPAAPLYELRVLAVGALVDEFTEAGVWVFFREGAPLELAEFALIHAADAPSAPIATGQIVEIDGQRYAITAVGELANTNIRDLGHMVLKVNGATTPELPGDVSIEARPLPQPTVGTTLRVWKEES